MMTGPSVRARAWSAGWSTVLAAAALGPLLGALFPGGGYLLLRDAVSTPRSHLTDSALGLSDAAARAVPQDAAVAALTTVIDGGTVVVGVLFLALVAAGLGASTMTSRLLGTDATGPSLVAATVAVWNPYVAERLLQGHWSLLVGYAALPWTVCAALRLRERGDLRAAAPLVLCLGLAGITPTGVLMCAALALVALCAPGGVRRGWRVSVLAASTVVVSAPWLIATAVSGAGAGSDPSGVAAFAARAEPGLATIGSLAGLGGIWNADAVPGSRTTVAALVGTVVLVGIAACGIPRVRRSASPVVVAVAALGIAAVVVAALAATPPGLAAGRWAAETVPGAGLFRDSHKWVALWMPALVLGAGAAVDGRRLRVPVAAVAALLIVLPDLAWGVHGAMRPVRYPTGWAEVTDRVGTSDSSVAVLPSGTFRRFDWSGQAPVLDPAPRWLRADVLQTGDLPVGAVTVQGESTVARRAESLLLDGAHASDLADLGVGWILVETSPGDLGDSARTLTELDRVYADDDLALYAVPDPAPRAATAVWPVGAAHVLWALAIAAAGTLSVREVRRDRSRSGGR